MGGRSVGGKGRCWFIRGGCKGERLYFVSSLFLTLILFIYC